MPHFVRVKAIQSDVIAGHEGEPYYFDAQVPQEVALLVEQQADQIARLKALCGRADAHIRGIDDWYQHHYHGCEPNGLDGDCKCGLYALLAELKEAAE
jgi:hypothetical protein